MSRIGRAPIAIPAGVEIKVEDNNVVTVKGPKGTLTQQFNPNMAIAMESGELKVTRPNDAKENRALHGLTRTLVHNMVVGVTDGYKKELDVNGVGYRVAKEGNKLVMNLGYSHQVIVEEKDGNSYNRITSVISLPAGMSAPTTETPLIAFDMDAWDDDVFNSLPVWIQDRIKKSTQYQKLHVPTDPVDVETSGGQKPEAAGGAQEKKEENPI